MQLTIAHLSDVHLSPIRGLGPLHANVKRSLGLANWLLKRRKVHLRETVDALTADLALQSLDHVIVSGDLANLGLPGEHQAALEWLQALGPPSHVSVVPGNHDIYCRLRHDAGVERWRDYMSSDAGGEAYVDGGEGGFPYVRLLDWLAIVGLNSAIPTAPFYAVGRLGEAQLHALASVLDRLGRDRLTRLVVIHHPPLPGQADARRGLADADRLADVLARHGAELVVHGHNHMDMHAVHSWSGGQTDVVGIASASVGRPHKHEPLGRYNIIHIETDGVARRVEIVSRGLAVPGGPVVEVGRRILVHEGPAGDGASSSSNT